MNEPLSVVSDFHLRAIGAVAVNWAGVEMVMELTILGLYEISTDRGLVLTANLSFQNKLTMLRILAAQGAVKDKVEAENLLDILKRIEAAGKDRNRIIHGIWGSSEVQGLATLMSIRVRGRRLSTTNEKIPLSEVEAAARNLLDLRFEMASLAVRIGVRPELVPHG
jgi:hypothetical protein